MLEFADFSLKTEKEVRCKALIFGFEKVSCALRVFFGG